MSLNPHEDVFSNDLLNLYHHRNTHPLRNNRFDLPIVRLEFLDVTLLSWHL
jgi:hypothetical protein